MAGTAILSIEIELGWGYHDLHRRNKYGILSPDRRLETKALKHLLEVCEKYDVKISFDVVGHLFLDGCSGAHGDTYPDGWFDADPGTDTDANPLFYAPDLIRHICDSNIDHEICTHTFSHVLGNEFYLDQLNMDIDTAQKIHVDELGEPAKSIVPPRHQPIDYNILKQNGIDVVRMPQGKMPENRIELLQWYFRRNHPVLDPVCQQGVITTYTSIAQSMTAPYIASGQSTVHPILRSIPLKLRKYAHSLYVDDALERAIENDKHAHFWTHLHDMANENQLDVVDNLIRLVAQKKQEKGLEMSVMRELRT